MHFDIANYIVDIILVVIFFGCCATGLAKGLVDMLTSAVSSIIAFIAAKIYAPRISGTVYSVFVENQLVKQTAKELEKLTASGQESLTAALPETIVSAASKAGFNLESMLSDSIGRGDFTQAAQTVISKIAQPVIIPVISFILFIIGAVMIYAVLRLLTLPVCALVKLPVLKEVNKTAGLLLGVVKGLFAVFCIAAIALFAASMFDGTAFADAVNNSYAAGAVASIING